MKVQAANRKTTTRLDRIPNGTVFCFTIGGTLFMKVDSTSVLRGESMLSQAYTDLVTGAIGCAEGTQCVVVVDGCFTEETR